MTLPRVLGVAVLAALGASLAILAISKRVIETGAPRRESLRILSVGTSGTRTLVGLPLNDATRAPGEYSIWFDDGRGYARLGAVTSTGGSTVVREVNGSTGTPLRAGLSARWSGVTPDCPADLGLAFSTVEVPTDLGAAPAYLFPARDGRPSAAVWAIHVHGQGATRSGPLRGVTVMHGAGLTSLVVSYRNDEEAPASPGRKSMLGQAEWRDVESALDYAAEHGAREFVLVGWSMGAAIALQLARNSRHHISGLCLIAPVTDWRATILASGKRSRIPAVLLRQAIRVLGSQHLRWVTGLGDSIDFDSLDWTRNAGELRVPTILLHSPQDRSVPIAISRAFAAAHWAWVDLVELPSAPHTLEWNRSPGLADGAVSAWIAARVARAGQAAAARSEAV